MVPAGVRAERGVGAVGGWWAVCGVWNVRGAPVSAVAASWWLVVRGVRVVRCVRVWGVLDWRPGCGVRRVRRVPAVCAVCAVCPGVPAGRAPF